MDDQGIYFDATRPSRLESLLNATQPFSESDLSRARGLITFKNLHGLSKYNAAPPFAPSCLPSARGGERVLLIDQTAATPPSPTASPARTPSARWLKRL